MYKDIRELVNIDLDTASIVDVRLLANQIPFGADREGCDGPTRPWPHVHAAG